MEEQKFELSHDALSKANIGLWAIEIVEGEEPRMYADATMCHLLGIPEGLPLESIYHAWYDHIDPNHYDAVADAVAKMVDGRHAEVQYPWRHPTKGETFVRCGGLRNYAYTRGIRLEGCHQDVTELIHIQKKAAQSELQNVFLQSMLKGIPCPFSVKTADKLSYCLCDEAFCELFKCSLAEILGKTMHDFTDADTADRFDEYDRYAVANAGVHYFPNISCTICGENHIFHTWATCVDGGDGHKYVVTSLLEVTELNRAEKAKSDFFAKVSHDIRTPLNAIIGYSQMLSAGGETPVERKEYLDSIAFSSEALLDLVNDVLDISKLEAGKMDIRSEPCDFGSLVRKVLRTAMPRATSRRVDLMAQTDGLPIVELDVRRMRQVLLNLVSNAVKFTERGTVNVIASFAPANEQTGTLTFSVCDTGVGIPEEHLKNIFQPFVQIDTGRPHVGTGLGLSICRQLVELMGGKLSATSELGKGSVFTVTIPNVAYQGNEGEADEKEPGKASDPLDVVTAVRGLRLLLVDDIKMNLMVLTSMLKRVDVTHVETVSDGNAAMDVLMARPTDFDAVLTDLWMPNCNGQELLAKIRAFGPTAHLPVYAVTADVQCTGGDGAKFSGVLLKPITLESLRIFVRGISR